MAEVISANLSKRIAVLDDGRTVPVTNLLDDDGDETDDLAEAVAFVCGARVEWYAETVADYDFARVQ